MATEELPVAASLRQAFRHRSLRLPFDGTRGEDWRRQLRSELRSLLSLQSPLVEDSSGLRVLWEEQRGGVRVQALRWPRAEGGAGEALWFQGAPSSAAPASQALLFLLADGEGSKAEWAGWLDRGRYLDIAWALAEVGYAVCALDLLGEGEEGEEAFRWGLLLHRPLLGLQVEDVLRWLQYALSRPEIDPARIGAIGFGGGALVTLLAAALEERLGCLVLSGFFGTWETVLSAPIAGRTWLVPGLPLLAELSDLLALIPPRPLFVELGKRDPLCPYPVARQVWLKVKYAYELAQAGDRVGWEIFEGGHRFWGKGALVWLRHRLKTWRSPQRNTERSGTP